MPKRMQNIHLVIIDPQEDFCNPAGALYVKGADKDMARLAKFVNKTGPALTDIHVTQDSHHPIHVAHPIYWRNSGGNHPTPFTIITHDDVVNGTWMAQLPSLQRHAESYTEQLKINGRYVLCIWPPHCLIGSDGHPIVPDLYNALRNWEETEFAIVDNITKGSNPNTEHYSAIQADVPDTTDPSTQLNTSFIQTLETADIILVTGEAGSHCVANTFRDVVSFGNPDIVRKMVALEDIMSPVPGFDKLQDEFLRDLSALGMRIETSETFAKNI